MVNNINSYLYKGFQIRDNNYGKSLILNDSEIEKSILFIKHEKIEAIEINYTLGYKRNDLDILREFPSIKHIKILNSSIDITGLFFLKKLETLQLSDVSNQKIDFKLFPNLKKCFFSWRKGAESIFECTNLLELGIDNYPFNDLKAISGFSDLHSLRVSGNKIISLKSSKNLKKLKKIYLFSTTKINNLSGIEYYPNISKVEFYNLKQLSDISYVSLLTKLESLHIENCKAITEIEAVETLINLRSLHLDNCSDIKSLKPIARLNNLEELYFIENTKITDGNLEPILGKSLKALRFMDRRHYTHKKKEFIKSDNNEF